MANTIRPPDRARSWLVIKEYNNGDLEFVSKLLQEHGPLGELEAWAKAFVRTPEAAAKRVDINDEEAASINMDGMRIFYEHRYDSRTALPMTDATNAGRVLPSASAKPIGIVTRTVHNPRGQEGYEVWVHIKCCLDNLTASEEKKLRDMLRSNEIADLSICYVEERTGGDAYKSGTVKKSIEEASFCRRGKLPGTHIIAVQASDSMADAETQGVNAPAADTAAPMNVDKKDDGGTATETSEQKPATQTDGTPSEKKTLESSSRVQDPMLMLASRLEAMEKAQRTSTEALLNMIKMGQLSSGTRDNPEPMEVDKKTDGPPPAQSTAGQKSAEESTAAAAAAAEKKAVDAAIKDQLRRHQDSTNSQLLAMQKQLASFAKSQEEEKKMQLETRITSLQARASKCDIAIPKDASLSTLDVLEGAIARIEASNKALEAEKKRTSAEAAKANQTTMSTLIGTKRKLPVDAPSDSGEKKRPKTESTIGSSVSQRFHARDSRMPVEHDPREVIRQKIAETANMKEFAGSPLNNELLRSIFLSAPME